MAGGLIFAQGLHAREGRVNSRSMKTCAGRGSPSVAIFGGIHGARRFAAGTEGRAAKLGSYGGLQRAREVACKVPDAWQSMWVDDSTAEAHARVRSAGKRARRGEQGLAAPVARDLGLLRLHRRKAHREALCV